MWAAQTISVVGSRMQMVAIRWHIFDLTHSYTALALISLFRFVPIVIFSMIGGAVADARDRRLIMLGTQSVLTFSALLLFGMTETGRITPMAIYALNALSAAAIAFDNPARQSLTPNLVPREHYANAASLNSISMNTATVVGPLLSGFFIGMGKLGLVYGVNAISFLAVIVALLRLRKFPYQSASAQRPQVNRQALKDGMLFVWHTPILVWIIVLDFLATFFSSADALLPAFATDVLHVGPRGYGKLAAAEAVGSLTAGAFLSAHVKVRDHGKVIIAAVLMYGVATIVFGASKTFWISWIALAVAGLADTVSTILRQTIRQLVTPDNLRGRMSATMMLFFMGGPQLGNVEAGLVAKWIGAPWSVITGGIGCVLATLWVAFKGKELRDYRLQPEEPG